MVRTRCTAAVFLCACVLVARVSIGQATQPATPQPPATQPSSTGPATVGMVTTPGIGAARGNTLSGATVAVPWPELAALLERAGDRAARPPVDVVFGPATYTARPAGDGVDVTADVQATVLRNDFALVPVAPAEVAVESVTVDGQPASLVLQGKTLSAFVTGGGKKSVQVTIKRLIGRQGGATRFDLPLADWPISTLKLTVPGRVDFTAPSAASVTTADAIDATTLTASYRGGAVAGVAWRARPAAAEAGSRLYGDSETRVSVLRGLMRYQTTLRLSIERAAATSVDVRIDPKAVLLSAQGRDVAGHQEAPGDANATGKLVTISFAGPMTGSQTIELVYEKDVAEAGGAEAIVAPVVAGARRDGGVVAVDTDGAYDLRPAAPDAQGAAPLERIGVSELPTSLRGPQTTLAYRYGSPGSVAVALTPVKPQPARVSVLTLTRVAIDRGVLRCQAHLTYDILHAGVDVFRLSFPPGAELVGVEGEGVRDTQWIDEAGRRVLAVGLKDVARKQYAMTVSYDVAFAEAKAAPATGPATAAATQPATRPATAPAGGTNAAAAATVAVPLLGHPDVAASRGYVGVEVRGGYELTTVAGGAERIDVKELPRQLWSLARSPLLEGYRYEGQPPALSLVVARHRDLDVLVAMADVCEAGTTVTADGRTVTKVMYVVRNNLKPHMTLRLPADAEIWSTFVDDRPVTPARTADGRVLIPLRQSEQVQEHDDDSYQSRRDRRRQGTDDRRMIQQVQRLRDDESAVADLKPYDVEVVFVQPAAKLGERGQLELALPQSDVPVGHLAWGVFLPKQYRVVDAQGTVNEVSRFTLPFRHFGEAALAQVKEVAELQKAQQMAQQLKQAAESIAEASKVAGVLPVRVEIPIAGEITRFEKLLVVDEQPKVTLSFSRKAE